MKVYAVNISDGPSPNTSCSDSIKTLEVVTITIFLLICYLVITSFLKKKFKRNYWGYIIIIAVVLFIRLLEINLKITLIPDFSVDRCMN